MRERIMNGFFVSFICLFPYFFVCLFIHSLKYAYAYMYFNALTLMFIC